jgi:hypothetical protein
MDLARAGQTHGTDAFIGDVQVFAEQLYNLQADLAMLAEEVEQLAAVHLRHLHSVGNLGRDLVAAAGKNGA